MPDGKQGKGGKPRSHRQAPAQNSGQHMDRGRHHKKRRPYTHVKVGRQPAKLPVGWHDGTTGKGKLSGELWCELTTLTPFLAGNEHYELSEAIGAVKIPDAELESYFPFSLEGEEFKELSAKAVSIDWFPGKCLHGSRSVIEPLFFEGRTVIPGTQIKGMIRQSLGALLAAPMERVQERSYSYRPNLKWPASPTRVLEPRPAVIRSTKTFQYKDNSFIVPDKIDIYPMGRPIFDKGGFVYRGGMGAGTKIPHLSKKHPHLRAKPQGKVEAHCLITDNVHLMWAITQEHLCDTTDGHISSRHPGILNDRNAQQSVQEQLRNVAQKGFAVDQLIFVEVEPSRVTSNGSLCVTSYGHHYYYRWRYTDTVLTRGGFGGASPTSWQASPRGEVSPAEFENLSGGEEKPEYLSGARALFGYASEAENGSKDKEGHDFSQLAGRISINFALEVAEAKNEEQRFLGPKPGFAVSLMELGAPKPSAAEFYIDQSLFSTREKIDQGEIVTYGDLPGRDPAGDLAGRKFYWHDNKATNGSWEECSAAGLANKRASIARFASRPDMKFRFKLRFSELSEPELGALLLALSPDKFLLGLPGETASRCGAKPGGSEAKPRYALKLGYARPLGWGSVYINVDKALEIGRSDSGQDLHALNEKKLLGLVKSAAAILDLQSVRAWLEIHDFQETSGKGPYPTSNGKIYSWHSDIRQKHSAGRRYPASDST